MLCVDKVYVLLSDKFTHFPGIGTPGYMEILLKKIPKTIRNLIILVFSGAGFDILFYLINKDELYLSYNS